MKPLALQQLETEILCAQVQARPTTEEAPTTEEPTIVHVVQTAAGLQYTHPALMPTAAAWEPEAVEALEPGTQPKLF